MAKASGLKDTGANPTKFQVTIVVHPNADGSGTINGRTIMGCKGKKRKGKKGR